MADIFAITTASEDSIKVNESGSTIIMFTATNKTDNPVRGVAKIKPLDNTQSEWLSIEGETERDFSANGTQQFTVNFNKPASEETEEAQNFPFRMDVVSSANPDEDFTEGPTVTVELGAKKAEEKKPFPIWIPIVAGVLLLAIIGGVVGYLLTRPDEVPVSEKIIVPDLVNKKVADAEKELTALGLKPEIVYKKARKKEADKVFDQNPEKGTEVEADSVVKLIVPLKKVKVPNVVALSYNDAEEELEALGLKAKKVFVSAKGKPIDKVLDQSPDAREEVESGTIVNLDIPKKRVKVPNLKGEKFGEAKTELEALGLKVKKIESKSTATLGNIFDQNPKAKEEIEEGTTVKLYVAIAPNLQYRAVLDCKHTSLNNTQTDNKITASLLDSSSKVIQSKSINKITNCNKSPIFHFSTSKTIKYIEFKTSGKDGFYIDKWKLLRKDTQIKNGGVDNGKGWCLSKDPTDAIGEWSAYIVSGCQPSFKFPI